VRTLESSLCIIRPADYYPKPATVKGQEKRPILNGRPCKSHAEPIGLYHPVFNEFQNAMGNTEPLCADVATYSTVRNLFLNIRRQEDTS